MFIALDPCEAARAEIAAWRREALAGPEEELRILPPESLHVTLAFLGHRPPETIPEIARVALGAVEGREAAILSARGVVGTPRRRPRLLALDLADPADHAAQVQGAVVEALAAAGMHEPETRPFWPHLTLARARGGEGRRGPRIEPPSDPHLPPGPLVFDSVALFRSRLSPKGARYEALERQRLGCPG